MKLTTQKTKIAFFVATLCAPLAANATNGMNLQGYGPIAGAMGGASMAYDNGLAATMNNPSTLGLMDENSSRFDLALGALVPTVSSTAPGSGAPGSKSTGGPYMMPATGYATHSGNMTYGVGVFAQGGMGTDYAADSFLAAGSNEKVRSELGVGRLIFPLAYNVDSKLTVGGSLDYVWAGLDLKMAMDGNTFGDMVAALGGTQSGGSASGSAVNVLAGALTGGQLTNVDWVRFDFSNNNDFTGKAHSTGYAGKIGFVYKATPQVTLGATYHSKTSLGDLKGPATVSMQVDCANNVCGAGVVTNQRIPVSGNISVKNFQWPETFGFGMAYKPDDTLMVVADWKHIGWKGVMKDFHMVFTADATQADPLASGFNLGGTSIDATLLQKWQDQDVFELGVAYKTTDALTLRAGVNLSTNPIPNAYTNPLFPAIFDDHVSLGFGYALSKASSFDASFVYAFDSAATSAAGVNSKVGGYEVQVMYSVRF